MPLTVTTHLGQRISLFGSSAMSAEQHISVLLGLALCTRRCAREILSCRLLQPWFLHYHCSIAQCTTISFSMLLER